MQRRLKEVTAKDLKALITLETAIRSITRTFCPHIVNILLEGPQVTVLQVWSRLQRMGIEYTNRSTVSNHLNELVKNHLAEKVKVKKEFHYIALPQLGMFIKTMRGLSEIMK